MRGFRSASHHVEARVSKWATSSTETEEEEEEKVEGDAFRGEAAAEVDEKVRKLPLPLLVCPSRIHVSFTSVLVPPTTSDHGRQQHDDWGPTRTRRLRGSKLVLVRARMMCCTIMLGMLWRCRGTALYFCSASYVASVSIWHADLMTMARHVVLGDGDGVAHGW